MVLYSGLKVGRWTLISEGEQRSYALYWTCQCECGTHKQVSSATLYGDLPKHRVISCGCWRRERLTTHGQSYSPEHAIWLAMLSRCRHPSQRCYHNYGGRGISVDVRWAGKGGFQNFLSDMGERPSPFHTLERENNDGNYTPKNCRWATRIEQASNKRNNHYLVVSGVSKTLSQWARESGLNGATIWKRLHRGWTPENAVSTLHK